MEKLSAELYRSGIKEGFIKEAFLGTAASAVGKGLLSASPAIKRGLRSAVGSITPQGKLDTAFTLGFGALTANEIAKGEVSVGQGVGSFLLGAAGSRVLGNRLGKMKGLSQTFTHTKSMGVKTNPNRLGRFLKGTANFTGGWVAYSAGGKVGGAVAPWKVPQKQKLANSPQYQSGQISPSSYQPSQNPV